MLQVNSAVFFLWPVLLLLLPAKWLLAAAAAAAIHEFFHVAAIRFLGGRVHRVCLGPMGAVIEIERIAGSREVICALAGPAGSLLLASLIHSFPILGLCGLVQGVFNLLPVYPMDGGRALLRLLEMWWPHKAERIAALVEICVLSGLLCAAVCFSARYSLGAGPSLFCLLMIGMALLRKKP